jgi:HD-GYP domain-containing protein (c-di-GMP phosphodiesterase class II)
MQILIALSKTEIREMLAFAVESKTGRRPFEASTGRESIDMLSDHGAVKVVICEYPGISDVLFRHIISLNRRRSESDQIQCIVCCGKEPEDDATVQKMNILGYASWTNLIDATLELLDPPKKTTESPREVPASDKELCDLDTCRRKTTLLIRVGLLRAGIYIRLSSEKYVKLFQEGDEFSEEDYSRILRDKKIEYLYLRKNECSEFLLKFKNDLLKLLQAEILTKEVNPDLLEEVHETAQELLNKIGATREVQEVVKANIQLTVKAMEKGPQLSDILKRFEIDRDKYISSHSVLLPQIACTLAMTMEWKSEATLQKLALAAFLHDIPMTNHALAAVTNLTELTRRKEQFSEDERKLYKSHPVKAAELAKQFQEVPPDVDTIVLQHHERPDGSGFPRGLGHHHISPLAAVFIVAHDIVSAIFDRETPFVLERFVETVRGRYQGGNFRKLYAQLSSLKF